MNPRFLEPFEVLHQQEHGLFIVTVDTIPKMNMWWAHGYEYEHVLVIEIHS